VEDYGVREGGIFWGGGGGLFLLAEPARGAGGGGTWPTPRSLLAATGPVCQRLVERCRMWLVALRAATWCAFGQPRAKKQYESQREERSSKQAGARPRSYCLFQTSASIFFYKEATRATLNPISFEKVCSQNSEVAWESPIT
jgi:hypothetical protein